CVTDANGSGLDFW
nr:immunoglobulin heavy chain junction region [Macaca mulatta]MOV56815.1 immunoglobulin heavy chain junction region [Macaca mulatta]MOV56978.1 immunoglobulin heavy chain junction region [Macaca mulatta]